ncbi:MAG: hypothetical protein ABJB86_04100 [Bacteroidota bacterium]
MTVKRIIFFFIPVLLSVACPAQKVNINYINSFENINHPQVAYWFFTTGMLEEKNYKNKIDSLAKYSKYTLIFLTQRDGVDFYDSKIMHPVFEKLVAYAHQKGLKIALQIWKDDRGVLLENTDRLMQEGEVQLDENGTAQYNVKATGARDTGTLLKSELFKIYVFKKMGEGFYDPASLREITATTKAVNGKETVSVSINAGIKWEGYTAYILTQHYYNSCSNFSAQAKSILLNAFKLYADIPFDGIGLDEYKNMKISRQKILETNHDAFRERVYSPDMAKAMRRITGVDLDRVLFDMRYAPEGKPAVRIKAINEYMSLLRTATLGVESAMYDLGKKMYGKDAFIGLHNTFHNNLDKDEVWQTGVSWWNIKRDYGHTDENTSTAIQMGIGMGYPKNAMYNMYYDHSLEKIWTKALYDLRFGVRTHYHAANDIDGWGVSIDAPFALKEINKVENAARLLNRFNPSFPAIKLLVVYGMEALYNWYPNLSERGLYDVNDHLGFERKSVELWQAGYLNAAVPTDMINDGRLKLNIAGKPVLNGYVFDAIVFLNPQYARKETTTFIKNFVAKGGKLLVEGNATRDFDGNDISADWKNIEDRAVATSFSLENIRKLGIKKNGLTDGVMNEDGSYTFTSIESLKTNTPATFSFVTGSNTFTGYYKGLVTIKVDEKGNLLKLAATGFSLLTKNGKSFIHLSKEADIFLVVQNGHLDITIADATKSIKFFPDFK